ncbi:MAG: guanylate kinase [Bacilli bacterium]
MTNILKSKSKGILIVISGPSGSGKDTICERLKEYNNNFWISISCTTRKPRLGEEDGVNYFFINEQEFNKKINDGDFLEYAMYNNCYYGTPRSKINEYLNKGIDVILIIEVKGALKIKSFIEEALFIFILPPTLKELGKRLKKRRTETKDKILERFRLSYKEINEVSKYNYVVVNDEIDTAAKKVNAIINAEKCRVDRIEEVFLNNIEEEIHELLIDDKTFNNEDNIL